MTLGCAHAGINKFLAVWRDTLLATRVCLERRGNIRCPPFGLSKITRLRWNILCATPGLGKFPGSRGDILPACPWFDENPWAPGEFAVCPPWAGNNSSDRGNILGVPPGLGEINVEQNKSPHKRATHESVSGLLGIFHIS